MSDIEIMVKTLLNTYATGRSIKSIEVYKSIKNRYPDFNDDERSYPNIRRIIANLENAAHNSNPLFQCIGSTSEGFIICKDRDQAFASAKHLLSKFVSTAIRYQLRKKAMNELFPKDEFSTPLFQDADPLPEWDLEKLRAIEKSIKEKGA